MRRLLVASLSLMVLATSSGCILSRLTDKAFVGLHVKRPTYNDRLVTGILLLPITAAVDLVTFPIQVIVLAIAGDDFIVGRDEADPAQLMYAMNTNPSFQKLDQQQQETAVAELDAMIKSGQITRGTALALTEDGHWLVIDLTPEARNQMLARAKSNASATALACSQ